VLLAQEVIIKDIISIDTHEKNAKTILFAKKVANSSTSFLLKAKNETSKDYSKCMWESTFSKDEIEYFVDALEVIELGTEFECHLFKLKYKKDKLNVHFNDTKCTSEHRIYYFQKSCKRSLSFVLKTDQLDFLINKLDHALNDNQLAKN
tara:strand:- start:608 stop:1054 length:447 start_codon:yes stop_codon:yes gene_type:complete